MNSFEIFAIYLKSLTNLNQAEEFSKTVKNGGGAGFILKKDSTYLVFASAYSNQEDALSVVENLKKIGHSPLLFEFFFEEISFNEDFSQNQSIFLSNNLNIFKTSFENLYEYSIFLDKNNQTEMEIKLEINKLLKNTQIIKRDFNLLFNENLSPQIFCLKISLDEILDILNDLSSYNDTFPSLSSKIKYSYFSTLLSCQNFHNRILI